ncbi:MAG: SHOCT domain-containing protein, partial [Deltaproteobacteria bacterium]|nr:SHOCT domain-containing protein [Deltaproteobacteria bacterium]
LVGAAIGAGIGVYKNLTKPNQHTPVVIEQTAPPKDVHAELLKLDELKKKKIITEAEFEAQKKKILEAST